MKILFVGDIMPGGVLPYQDKYIDADLLEYLKEFELRVGTLECAIGTTIPYDQRKMDTYKSIVYARDADFERVKELNINIVSLANNHAFDLGVEGLKNTINTLQHNKILFFGAGMNIEEAKQPAVINVNGKTLAFIGCLMDYRIPYIFYPPKKNEPCLNQVNIDELCDDIAKAKRKYDYVVVMPHWGIEHEYLQPVYFKNCAYKIIEAGADALIGGHPHIINPTITRLGKPIFFSLGNFLFPEKCMQVPRPMYYPETAEECHSLKRMWTYPKSISEPIVAVWKPKNRIGMMVEMEIGEKIKTSYRLTCLTADNILHHYESKVIRLRMRFWSLLVKMPKYGFVRRLYNHRYNILRRIIDKLPAFNIPVEL